MLGRRSFSCRERERLRLNVLWRTGDSRVAGSLIRDGQESPAPKSHLLAAAPARAAPTEAVTGRSLAHPAAASRRATGGALGSGHPPRKRPQPLTPAPASLVAHREERTLDGTRHSLSGQPRLGRASRHRAALFRSRRPPRLQSEPDPAPSRESVCAVLCADSGTGQTGRPELRGRRDGGEDPARGSRCFSGAEEALGGGEREALARWGRG